MKMTIAELLKIEDYATKEYINMPGGVRLTGTTRPLSEGERRCVAFFMASTRVLNERGLFRDGPVSDPDMEFITSEVETDGA
jgi:hypothetical protein